MYDIDLKIYKKDNMDIREIMSNSNMGNLNLKTLFLYLSNKFTLYNRNLNKRKYLF